MQAPAISSLVQHDSGLWEATVVVGRREIHFGFFFDRAEAERTLAAAITRYGGKAAVPEEA
jgi:hypothetical protein